jgi:hypothetical protein
MRSARWVAFVLVVLAAPLGAQGHVWAGGAITIPVGDSENSLKQGWLADFGWARPLAKNDKISLHLGGLYGANEGKTGAGLDLLAASVGLSYSFSYRGIEPYALTHLGVMRMSGETRSENEPLVQMGGGISKKLNETASAWVEARYLTTTGNTRLSLIPLTAGLSFSVGGQ